MLVYDQLNRPIKLENTPQRIVSLVPSQTELLVDLGLEDKLVGVTKFCVHPVDIKQKVQVVGGTKQIHIERLKAVNPDIVLCNKEENTKAMVDEIAQFFPVHVADVETIEDTYQLITQYGDLFDVADKAAKINTDIEKAYLEFKDYVADKPKLKVAYFIWRKPWMVVGNSTFVNYLLEQCKFENVYADLARYPEVDITKLKDMDYLLLSSEPFPFAEKHRQELLPFIGKKTEIKFVDGEFFSWYGSRLRLAFTYFKQLHELL